MFVDIIRDADSDRVRNEYIRNEVDRIVPGGDTVACISRHRKYGYIT